VHRSAWPTPDELLPVAKDGDPDVLSAASVALSALRKVKSERKLSMRSELASAVVHGPQSEVARAQTVAPDLRAAGRVVGDFTFEITSEGVLSVDVAVAPE
jgi:valyl-tRNA synthetase